MNEEDRLEEKIKSKNWKERQEAYTRLGMIWHSSNDCLSLLPLLQNESNIPALETAIDALLKTQTPPPLESVRKIFNNIGNSKTTIKNGIYNLIEHIASANVNGVVKEMIEIVYSKAPKNVIGAVSALNNLVPKFNCSLEDIGGCLKDIFGHSDKTVRSEGVKLCVELYKIHGEKIKQYLKDLKPIQMKELEEEFGKIQVIDGGNQQSSASSKVELSSTLLKKCNDDKWNIRLEGLTDLKKIVNSVKIDNEILSLIYSRVNDPNNQVFFELLEILSILKLKNQRVVASLIDRLKDKKVAVTDKIKETLLKMELPEDFITKDFFNHKSPQVKINLIDFCMAKRVTKKEILNWIGGCAKDQSAQVRTKALEAIRCLSGTPTPTQPPLTRPGTPAKVPLRTPQKAQAGRVAVESNQKNYFGPTKEEKENVLDSFYSKYPFFKDKNWNKRLEGVRENESRLLKEDIKDLSIFFYSFKEAVFQLNLIFMDLLIFKGDQLHLATNTIALYCLEKITESKLQNKIVQLISLLERKEVFEVIKLEIKSLKQGKKLISLLWLLGELLNGANCEVDEVLDMQVIGINEKKALEALKVKYLEAKGDSVRDGSIVGGDSVRDGSIVGGDSVRDGSIVGVVGPTKHMDGPSGEPFSSFVEPPSKDHPNLPTFLDPPRVELPPSTERKTRTVPSKESKRIVKESIDETLKIIKKENAKPKKIILLPNFSTTRVKGTGSLEEVFTPEFIRTMREEDFTKVVNAFDSVNKIPISDFVIKFYIDKKLSCSYFNSLILYFISEKYILNEFECSLLVRHLLENDMNEELKMIDRVYPVTKLFFVLQRIDTDKSLTEILRLIESYKMFRGNKKKLVEEAKKINRQALQKAIKGCPDFLSFVDEIDGQFLTPRKGARDACGEEDGNVNEGSCGKGDHSLHKDGQFVGKHKNNPIVFEDPFRDPPDEYVDPVQLRTKIAQISGRKKEAEAPLTAPSVLEDSFEVENVESSLLSMSFNSNLVEFSTPNLKKFRKDFESPLKRRNSLETLEEILDSLIDCDQAKSEKALKSLSYMINNSLDSLLFSANSIISSISIQLLDVLHRPLYATLILNVLLKLSKNKSFCEQLRVETLESVNSDLITMLGSLNRGSLGDQAQLVGDIITNLCINSKPGTSLQVYLNLFVKGASEVPLKLIWRHSKNLQNLIFQDIQEIVEVLEGFYSKNIYSPTLDDYTTFKILILHLKELVLRYPEDLEKLNLRGHTKKLVNLYKNKVEVHVGDLRDTRM